jgi:hypothetical protein
MTKNIFDIYSKVKKNDDDRNTNDLYPTPPLGSYCLLHTLGKRVPQKIIEPCAGRGHIAAELRRHGREVFAYDLFTYENQVSPVVGGVDATTLDLHGSSCGVITNPPYHKDLPRKLTEKFIAEYDFVAMFLRLTFLEGKKRKKMFTERPPSDIIFLSDRINFGPTGAKHTEAIEKKDQIGGMIAYMWIVWDKNSPHINTRTHWVMLEDLYDEWRANYDRSIGKNTDR